MKKIMMVLMTCCLLLAVSFAAAAQEVPVMMQDELPPTLVIDEGVAAKVLDAEDKVLAEITDAALLKLTDVHQRTEEAMPDVRDRLLNAYLNLMSNVHYGDVMSAFELENLKTEIDLALKGSDLTAFDLEIFEIFDVKLLGEQAALMTEEAVLEFTVRPEEIPADKTINPILVAFSPDGEKWHLLHDYTCTRESNLTLRVPSDGTVALLLDFAKYYEIAEDDGSVVSAPHTVTHVTEINPNFTASAAGKPAPTIVTTVEETGRSIVARIKHTENTEVFPIFDDEKVLVVTPVAESAYSMDVTTHEHLQWAYDSILQAESVSQLFNGFALEIDEVLKTEGHEDMTHQDLVVRDLFEVTIYGGHMEKFYDEATYLELRFAVELEKGDPLVVLYSSDSHNWKVLPNDCMRLSNGVVTLKLNDLGAVAFAVEKPETVEPEAVQSPE